MTDSYLEVAGPEGFDGFDVDLHAVGELAPSVAAIAALAEPGSVSRLRRHRTSAGPRDRPAGRADRGDQRTRRSVRGVADGLVITARPLHGNVWRSYADHRMATAGAIVGLQVVGVAVEDIGTTAKTLPDFPRMWADMLAGQVPETP